LKKTDKKRTDFKKSVKRDDRSFLSGLCYAFC